MPRNDIETQSHNTVVLIVKPRRSPTPQNTTAQPCYNLQLVSELNRRNTTPSQHQETRGVGALSSPMLCTTVPGIFFVCLEKGSLYHQCQSCPPVCCSGWQMAAVYPGFTSAASAAAFLCAVIQVRSSNVRVPKAHSPLALLLLRT